MSKYDTAILRELFRSDAPFPVMPPVKRPWWHIGWWLRWHLRDPGDAMDARWCDNMGLPHK